MQILRIVISFLTVVTVAAAVFFTVQYQSTSESPVITCTVEKTIEAPCSVTDDQLLELVTATDATDGDLTDHIVVERKMFFIDKGLSRIIFSVCDSDNNVTKLARNIHFTDYVPPRIYAKNDLIFRKGSAAQFSSCFTASDVFGGDISSNIKIISTDFSGQTPGTYRINCKVSNAMGDTCDITLPVIVTEQEPNSAITLSRYTDYFEKGQVPDFSQYIIGVYSEAGHYYTKDDVQIDASGFRPDVPGVYSIDYAIYRGNGAAVAARTRLIAIVEG